MGILRKSFEDVFEIVRGQNGTFQQMLYFPRRHSQLWSMHAWVTIK